MNEDGVERGRGDRRVLLGIVAAVLVATGTGLVVYWAFWSAIPRAKYGKLRDAGDAAYEAGDLATAQRRYGEALVLARDCSQDEKVLRDLLFRLAGVSLEQNDYPEAITCWTDLLASYGRDAEPNLEQVRACHQTLRRLKGKTHSPQEALAHAQRAVDISRDLPGVCDEMLVSDLLVLAKRESLLQDFESAEKHLAEARGLILKHWKEDSRQMGEYWKALSFRYWLEGRGAEQHEAVAKANEIAIKNGDPPFCVEVSPAHPSESPGGRVIREEVLEVEIEEY
ncbi:MAG: tetratricopeptide repeat protein [Phycisphaerae bacterium]|nr:tetratricopeptide repeat protein [Phycisphaerae bacterium]